MGGVVKKITDPFLPDAPEVPKPPKLPELPPAPEAAPLRQDSAVQAAARRALRRGRSARTLLSPLGEQIPNSAVARRTLLGG